MHNPALVTLPFPCRADCAAAAWASLFGAALFAAVVAALEAWLRFPVRSLLDDYLQDARSLVAAFARKSPF